MTGVVVFLVGVVLRRGSRPLGCLKQQVRNGQLPQPSGIGCENADSIGADVTYVMLLVVPGRCIMLLQRGNAVITDESGGMVQLVGLLQQAVGC